MSSNGRAGSAGLSLWFCLLVVAIIPLVVMTLAGAAGQCSQPHGACREREEDMPAGGINEKVVAETPISVLDLETTGLNAGGDRVVEVSVVRMEPHQEPKLVLDTLVNPDRHVTATEIHGITDADVTDAPTFAMIAGDLVRAMAGSVVAAYNVYFDMRFLEFDSCGGDRAGTTALLPDVPATDARTGAQVCPGRRVSALQRAAWQRPPERGGCRCLGAIDDVLPLRDEAKGNPHLRGCGVSEEYKFVESFEYAPFSLDLTKTFRRATAENRARQGPLPYGNRQPLRLPPTSEARWWITGKA